MEYPKENLDTANNANDSELIRELLEIDVTHNKQIQQVETQLIHARFERHRKQISVDNLQNFIPDTRYDKLFKYIFTLILFVFVTAYTILFAIPLIRNIVDNHGVNTYVISMTTILLAPMCIIPIIVKSFFPGSMVKIILSLLNTFQRK